MNSRGIEKVLSHYPIHPRFIETNGKVTKVEASEGTFALKETQIQSEQAERFIQTLRFFEKQQMNTVVPVCRTINGEWCCMEEGSLYYLMPWGKSCRGVKQEAEFFKALAFFHRSTEYSEPVPEEMWRKQGEEYRQQRDQELLELEAFADEVEKKRYFSPFELSFLMHFPFLYHLHKDSLYWYEQWEREASREEKIKVVRCHGRPSPDHIVIEERGGYRFVNLEATADGHPVHDTAYLFIACMQERMWEPVEAHSWVQTYNRHFPTGPRDEFLLRSRLLQETTIFPFLQNAKTRSRETEADWTFQWEQNIWLLEKIKDDIENWPVPKDEDE